MNLLYGPTETTLRKVARFLYASTQATVLTCRMLLRRESVLETANLALSSLFIAELLLKMLGQVYSLSSRLYCEQR
eukprot:884930-Rhodomonas_salina.2